ncbi:MAG TPA: hypothetical protein VGK99_05140 [Acidobacteriota bacterium]
MAEKARAGWTAHPVIQLLIVAGLVLLAVALRARYLDWVTIDWDEDLYRAYAQDLLRGKLLYRDIWDHKPPGIFYLFALIRLLNPSLQFFRIVAIAWGAGCGLILYAIGRRLWGFGAGCLAFLGWTAATADTWGSQSNSELFFTLFTLAGVWLFVCCRLPRQQLPEAGTETGFAQLSCFVLVGLFCGMAFQFKPVTLADFAAVLLTAAVTPQKARRQFLSMAILGFLLPSLAVFLFFACHGLLGEWLYAVYTYNFRYVSDPIVEVLQYGPRNLKDVLLDKSPLFLPGFAGLGLMARRERREVRFFFWFWVILSFLSISLGLKFLKHYFLQWMAPMSLAAGYYLAKPLPGHEVVRRAMLAGFLVWVASITYFQAPDLVKKIQDWRPVPVISGGEAGRTAAFLNSRLSGQSVYVWRSPYLSLYWLTGGRPATRFLFWRHLTRRPLVSWIEDEWQAALSARPPDVIINSELPNSSLKSDLFMRQFIRERYRILRRLRVLTIYERKR